MKISALLGIVILLLMTSLSVADHHDPLHDSLGKARVLVLYSDGTPVSGAIIEVGSDFWPFPNRPDGFGIGTSFTRIATEAGRFQILQIWDEYTLVVINPRTGIIHKKTIFIEDKWQDSEFTFILSFEPEPEPEPEPTTGCFILSVETR